MNVILDEREIPHRNLMELNTNNRTFKFRKFK